MNQDLIALRNKVWEAIKAAGNDRAISDAFCDFEVYLSDRMLERLVELEAAEEGLCAEGGCPYIPSEEVVVDRDTLKFILGEVGK